MRNESKCYGTYRDNKRKLGALFIGMIAVGMIHSCTPIMPVQVEEEDAELIGEVKDWNNQEGASTTTDGGRTATHADSIRLGLLPPDE